MSHAPAEKKTRNLGEADKPDRKVTSAQIDPGWGKGSCIWLKE
jgi:hypothetical protein